MHTQNTLNLKISINAHFKQLIFFISLVLLHEQIFHCFAVVRMSARVFDGKFGWSGLR